ncbi:MAG: hypothetical protein AAF570_08015, partial [Bacteroidota bacterium]
DLPSIRIRGGMFSFVDSTKSDSVLAKRERVNFSNVRLRRIHGDFAFRLNEDKSISGHIRDFTVFEAHSRQFVNEFRSNFRYQPDSLKPGGLRLCFDQTLLRTGRTRLDFDGELENARPDSVPTGFQPRFSALFRPSVFDFTTLNFLLKKNLPMRDPAILEGYVRGDLDAIYSDSLYIGIYDDTRLRTSLILSDYTRSEDLAFELGIREGRVSFDELDRFISSANLPLAGIAHLKGKVRGTLQKIDSKNLHIRYGNDTEMRTKVHLYDYAQGDDLMMNIRFQDSYFSFEEVGKLLPGMALPPWFSRFGRCNVEGSFVGGVSDFAVKADVKSDFGLISSNLHLELPPNVSSLGYTGWVRTENFNIDALNPDLGLGSKYFNFDGQVAGEGDEWGKIKATVVGEVRNSELGGYHLDAVEIDSVTVDSFKIKGEVRLRDRQGNARLTLDLSLPDSSHFYDIRGEVENIDLAHYDALPDDSVLLTSFVNVILEGDSIENYTGRLKFFNTELTRKRSEEKLAVSSIRLRSELAGDRNRRLVLKSSMANFKMSGQFKINQAIGLVGRLVEETNLYILTNDSLITDYYASKVPEIERISHRDTLTIRHKMSDVLDFFRVPIHLAAGTEVHTTFDHNKYTDMMNLQLRSDSMNLAGLGFKGDSIFFSLHKATKEKDLLVEFNTMVDELAVSEKLKFESVSLTSTAGLDNVDYELKARQPAINNDYKINANTVFFRNGRVITSIDDQHSEININGTEWRFERGNSILRRFTSKRARDPRLPDTLYIRYLVNNLILHSEGQEIKINGAVSENVNDAITLTLSDLRIHSLLEILEAPADVDGVITHSSVFASKLLSKQPQLGIHAEVRNLRYGGIKDSIGVNLLGYWPSRNQPDSAYALIELGHLGYDSLEIEGFYNVLNDSIRFAADSSTVLLSWLSPFLEGTLSDLEGKLELDLDIEGTLAQPRIDGEAHFTNTQFKVDFLNNTFRLGDNTLYFDNEKITIPNITVHHPDTLSRTAQLEGSVFY